jgi:hypothetical protein
MTSSLRAGTNGGGVYVFLVVPHTIVTLHHFVYLPDPSPVLDMVGIDCRGLVESAPARVWRDEGLFRHTYIS